MAWDGETYREGFPKFTVPALHLLEEQLTRGRDNRRNCILKQPVPRREVWGMDRQHKDVLGSRESGLAL